MWKVLFKYEEVDCGESLLPVIMIHEKVVKHEN